MLNLFRNPSVAICIALADSDLSIKNTLESYLSKVFKYIRIEHLKNSPQVVIFNYLNNIRNLSFLVI